MRAAVISDIHANLEALEAVFRIADRRRVDRWICLGDIVGYGSDPAACLGLVRRLTDLVVLGNHDAAVVGLIGTSGFNPYAQRAARWTAEQLTPEERRYLADLPLTRQRSGALLVHAEPEHPEGWGYIFSAADAAAALAATDAALCFLGHSHQPLICATPDGEDVEVAQLATDARVQLAGNRRYLINVGSVGQPRDGDSRACFALWDDREEWVKLVRVDYDIPAAQGKIRRAGLPEFLAERLAVGR